MHVIPALGSLKQEDFEFEASLRYTPRPKTNIKNRNFQANLSKAIKSEQVQRHASYT